MKKYFEKLKQEFPEAMEIQRDFERLLYDGYDYIYNRDYKNAKRVFAFLLLQYPNRYESYEAYSTLMYKTKNYRISNLFKVKAKKILQKTDASKEKIENRYSSLISRFNSKVIRRI